MIFDEFSIKTLIRPVPDFPKPGVIFRDRRISASSANSSLTMPLSMSQALNIPIWVAPAS